MMAHEVLSCVCLFFNLATKVSANKMVDLGSIPGWVKPKTMKIGIYSFPY